MSRNRLIKRLSWYYPTELFNVFLFTGIAVWQLVKYGFQDTLFLTYGLFVMVVILFEGQYYWKKKLDRLKGANFDQQSVLQLFRFAEKLNIALILLMPLVLALHLYINGWGLRDKILLAWAILANVFAVLEHINYYHKQLMYDNKYDMKYLKFNKRLKIASLRKDLDENKL